MTDDLLDYVRAALVLQGYRLDATQIAEIATEFSRIDSVARGILTLQLASDAEPAPVFRP